MANIVVSWHNQILFANKNARSCFYQAFIDGLKEAGNNILVFENLKFIKNIDLDIPEIYYEKIIKFKPDLFIFFNNQFWDISKKFDIPIVIYDVDSPNVFCNLEKLKEEPDRYKYIVTQLTNIETIKERIGCKDKNIKYIQPFTNIKNINKEQYINILFCGSPWLFPDFNDCMNFAQTNHTYFDSQMAIKVLSRFMDNPQKSTNDIYKELNLTPDISRLNFENIQIATARLSGAKRLRYLNAIYDLGLEIRGYCWNSFLLNAFPEVLLAYSNKPVYDTKTTEEFYNSGKIGFNTKHLQAKSGFSWRVCDILASNACLVTEECSDLNKLGFKVPTFSTPTEARECCIRILKNDNLRNDIVSFSHELIEKNHRFKSALPMIEDFLNINLHSSKEGHIEICQVLNFYVSSPKKKYENYKQKIYHKLYKYFYKKCKK